MPTPQQSGFPSPVRPTAVVFTNYLAQGVSAGLGALIVGVLAQRGASLETQVGLLAGGALPWTLKFALALVLDLGPSWPFKIRGAALAWIMAATAGALLLLARGWSGGSEGLPGSLATVALAWVALNLLLAVQDVIVDGLAVDTLAEHRALAGTAMGLGHALGFGLLAPLWLTPRILSVGMSAGLRLPALMLVLLAPILLVLTWIPGRPQKARDRDASREAAAPGHRLQLLLSLAVLVLLALLTFAPNLTQAVSAQLLFAELGWDYGRFAQIVLPIGAVAGILGTAACGPLVARLGPARAAAIAAGGLAAAWLIFSGFEDRWADTSTIVTLAIGEGLLQPALLVALHALALGVAARSPLPTTGFVLAMAALNLPRVIAPLLAPQWLAALGWPGLFAACGATMLVAGLLVALLRDWEPARA